MSFLTMTLSTRNLFPYIGIFVFVIAFATVAKGQDACSLGPCKNSGDCTPDQQNFTYTCHCTGEFSGQNCTELSFKASIGIYDVEKYLPGVKDEIPDMTNFKARRLFSSVSLTFASVALSRPNTYKWTLNGKALNPASNSGISVSNLGGLTINSGSSADEGEYQVFVSNEFGTLFSRKIKLKFSVTGTFLSPNTPINISMVENEPFLLPCPPRTYSYRVDYDWSAQALKPSSIANNPWFAPRILMEPNGDLLFSFVNRSDFTTFINQGQPWNWIRCSMNDFIFGNAVGPPVYFYVTTPATQSPKSLLKFYTVPQGVYNVLTGGQFYLNCTAGGRPVPRIQWYRNGVLITDLRDLFEHQIHNRTLRLGRLSSSIHDGNYKCEAVSGVEKLEAFFDVRVIETNSCSGTTKGKNFEYRQDNVAAIYASLNDQYDLRAGKYGGSVTMFCNTTGHPITSRTWYYNGVELQYRPKFDNRWSVDPSNGTLEISNLRLNDFGFYQCLAKNVLSEDDRRSLLVVTGAPLPPINVNTTDCANHTTNLTWGVRLPQNLLPPIGFIIEWRARPTASGLDWPAFSKLFETMASGSTRFYVVNNLKPYNEIQFRIRAKNNLGIGFPRMMANLDSCTTNSTKPSLYPKNLKASPGPSDGMLNVSWTALDPVDWSGSNCNYRLFFRPNTPNATWDNATRVFNGCGRSQYNKYFSLPNTEYEIAIRAENVDGAGPSSPFVRALSGQNRAEPPINVTIVRVDARSVELRWNAIPVLHPKTVDGYWVLAIPGPNIYNNRQGPDCPEGCEIPPPPPPRPRKRRFARAVSELPPADPPFPNGTIGVRVDNGLRGVVTGLKPWTLYTMAVMGYNNVGLGAPHFLTITTLDSKDSYYILSLRITSEAFTEDLRDESSSRFINLKRDLTREVSSLYQNHRWFKNASLLSFRPGSVQAELQLEVASPNMSVVREVVAVMDNLGNFSLDRNVTEIRSEPGIQSVTVNASNVKVKVGGKIVLNCTVIGGPEDLNITWSKAGAVIGLTHRTKVETRLRQSLLTIRDIMAEDDGNYSCQASKGIQNGIAIVTIVVLPVLEIRPRTISKRVGDQATFTCVVVSGDRQGARVSIVEVTNKDAEVRHQDRSSFTAVNLQIPGGGESYTRRFVCEMWLQQQFLSRSQVAELIIVPPEALKCPAEQLEGVSWVATAAGGTDVQSCPKGASGTASRECSQEAAWKNASFIGCSSAEFARLGDEIEAVTEDFQTDFTAQEILSLLVNVSEPATNNSRRPIEIYGGDLVISVNILVRLADYNSNQGNVSSTEDVNNYAQVTSNLLDSINSRTWQKLEKADEGRSQILVKAVDDYGLGVAATFDGSTKSETVQTKNLVLRVDRVDQDSQLRQEGLFVSYNESSIYLPPQALLARDARVVTLVYLTLNDVLPLAKDKNDDEAHPPNTTVVSSTIEPRPPDELKHPVKIILQNRMVNVPPGVTPKAECVFWRPGAESALWQTSGCRLVTSESDVTMTTCECNHLTIFASLMDPYGSSIGEADKKALEIISIVGCTISLLAVLVTIAVTLFFWRVVKSPRAKVLLNLCAAVALSCIFVICEGSARVNKAGCTVIAVFLHYFLLALFSWMLCEGVLLYILLVKVFGGGAEEKVKYFYIFGWGFPAIIVVISLAATQADGYGTTEVCWLDVPSGLIWAFIAPALIIILINIVVFILVIRQMMGTRHVQNKTQIEKVRAGFKASAVILPLLGITWIFGLLSFNTSTVAFKYIFAILNSLQGLMIFIFHCLLNKQIKDAIKRRREKTSSGVVSTTPKSKASTGVYAKHAVNQPRKVSAPKKRSNRAENDYEMMDTVTSDKNNTLSTLQSNSRVDKNAIINIPDEQLPEVITRLREAPEELNELQPKDDGPSAVPVFEGSEEDNTGSKVADSFILPKDDETLPKDDRPSVVSESSEDSSADGKTACESLIPHAEEVQTSGQTQEIGDELAPGHRGSLQGVTNRLYDQTPKGYDPSVEELIRESEEARFTPKESSSSSSSDSEAEAVEFSAQINPEVNPEDVSCVVEEAPLEGALPSTSSEITPALRTTKMIEPREFDDDVKNDEDFEIKMRDRRQKVDTLQRVAEAFTSRKEINISLSPSTTAWDKLRQKVHRRSYKVDHPGGTPDKTAESRPDDVKDPELV